MKKIPPVLTPVKVIEIMLETAKRTLGEYFKTAREIVANGEKPNASSEKMKAQFSSYESGDNFRNEILKDLGLDNDPEIHPNGFYLLALQKYLKRVKGFKEQSDEIKQLITDSIILFLEGRINKDNIDHEEQRIDEFVKTFFVKGRKRYRSENPKILSESDRSKIDNGILGADDPIVEEEEEDEFEESEDEAENKSPNFNSLKKIGDHLDQEYKEDSSMDGEGDGEEEDEIDKLLNKRFKLGDHVEAHHAMEPDSISDDNDHVHSKTLFGDDLGRS